MDKFRRRYIAALDKSYQSQFKKLRFLFIKNQEDIPPDGQVILKNIREQFHELGTGYMFKENLRAICANAEDAFDARNAFRRWARAAEATEIHELQAMKRSELNCPESSPAGLLRDYPTPSWKALTIKSAG